MKINVRREGGCLASHVAAPGSSPSIPKILSEEKIIYVADVNQWHWLEESGQWLENVN